MTVNMTLDGFECPIERPLDNEIQQHYYSGKKKRHTIKYEIGVQIISGKVVWLAGDAPGSVHDLQMARSFSLITLLLPGEKVLADKAYIGENCFIHPFKPATTEEEKKFNTKISSIRETVEHTIGRIKLFQFLKQQWRHDLDLHPVAVKVVCHALNIELHSYPIHKL